MMGNHYHLVLETPNANLVAGMAWLQSTYTIRLNHRHKLFGHGFSGRYKAQLVEGSGNGHLRTACVYVHLNPVRAGLLSSGERQDTAEGRQEFEQRMEVRRLEAGEPESLKALRRGWCLGSEGFRQEKLEQVEEELGENQAGALRHESWAAKAERLVGQELKRLGWTEAALATRRKSDPLKLAIGAHLRRETTLSLKAIAARVHLGTSKGANANLHKWMQARAAENSTQSHSYE
jgi:hypothetical protein